MMFLFFFWGVGGVFSMLGCSRGVGPDCGVQRLSYVVEPAHDGAPCMFDEPLLLYWSDEGITASIWDKETNVWIYHTYGWLEVDKAPGDGEATYGIFEGGFFFPGVCPIVWNASAAVESAHED